MLKTQITVLHLGPAYARFGVSVVEVLSDANTNNFFLQTLTYVIWQRCLHYFVSQ
jgi:hypothetical protein